MMAHINIGIPFYFPEVSLHGGEPFTQYLPPCKIIYRIKKNYNYIIKYKHQNNNKVIMAAMIACPSLCAIEYKI